MMNKYFLGSLLALLGYAGLAHAQAGLGAPAFDESGCSSFVPVPYPVYSAECRPDCTPRPAHPILEKIARRLTMPIRPARCQLMPPHCEQAPTRTDVARMIAEGSYSPAEVAVAKIKLEEAQAKARHAAVKYLSLVDCRHYPEAEAGLIAALRADRSEMVRFEAALALGNSRTLTGKMLEALNVATLGLELDGNPAETSESVREAARAALQRCAARGLCLPPIGAPGSGAMDWPTTAPFAVQPVSQVMPAYVPTTFPVVQREVMAPASPPVTQRDRELAATVSTPTKTAAGSRPLLLFLRSFTSGGEAPHEGRSQADPRLRGLAPLGAEGGLAIPASIGVGATPERPYTNR